MADPKSVWISDAEGNKASVADADNWKPMGWAESADPQGEDMVWLTHEVTGGKARFNSAAVPMWAPLGWNPGSPPEPIDVLHDQQLVDPQVVDVTEEPATSDAAPKKAATSKKEQ